MCGGWGRLCRDNNIIYIYLYKVWTICAVRRTNLLDTYLRTLGCNHPHDPQTMDLLMDLADAALLEQKRVRASEAAGVIAHTIFLSFLFLCISHHHHVPNKPNHPSTPTAGGHVFGREDQHHGGPRGAARGAAGGARGGDQRGRG